MRVDTCRGCRWFKTTMVRGQWENMCRRTGKTAPMKPCLFPVPKFRTVLVEQPAQTFKYLEVYW